MLNPEVRSRCVYGCIGNGTACPRPITCAKIAETEFANSFPEADLAAQFQSDTDRQAAEDLPIPTAPLSDSTEGYGAFEGVAYLIPICLAVYVIATVVAPFIAGITYKFWH